ncbi:unnamed protein product [Haemonchus placei]|uniref:Myosin_tail_1 domain-containing protein n=1 Tax=Haemonchus placei TaxID=6290 RepID=A0A0N4XB40_HAEPC|nr:unnamed protein product [Haemonchus placei]
MIREQEQQVLALLEMSEMLKSENEQLRQQEEQLRVMLEETTRNARSKEEELRKEFSDQIGLLIENTAETDYEDIVQKCGQAREEELLRSDARVQELLAEIREIHVATDEEIQSLKSELHEERQKRIELETVAQRNKIELEATRDLAYTKQNELYAVRCELNRRLKENMESEFAMLSKEENFHEMLMQRTTSFEKKIAETDYEDIVQKCGQAREEELLRSDARVQDLLNRLELEASRDLADSKQNELHAIRCELNRRLKENMENEFAMLSKEDSFHEMLMQRTASFEKKIAEYERTIEEKDEQLNELRKNVELLESQTTTGISLKDDEEKRRLESELKSLSLASKQKEEKNKAIIEELKQERNKLEIKQAGNHDCRTQAYPSKTAELNRLRSLLEEKEEKLSASRRRYRNLLRKVETSLAHLEKQHQKTKRKLEENIIGSGDMLQF